MTNEPGANFPTLNLHPVLFLALPTQMLLLPWEDFPYGNTRIILEMVTTNGHVGLHLVCRKSSHKQTPAVHALRTSKGTDKGFIAELSLLGEVIRNTRAI